MKLKNKDFSHAGKMHIPSKAADKSFCYETVMKQAFAADKIPDQKFSEELFRQAEERENEKVIRIKHMGTGNLTGGRAGKAAVAVIALCLIVGAGTAVVKGSPLSQWFVSGGGNKTKSTEAGKYRAKILSYEEKETIPHLQIRPEKFVTDGEVSYVVLEIQGDENIPLSEDMFFESFSLYSDEAEAGDGELSQTVLDMDLEKNVLHLAVTDHSQVIKEKGIIEWSLYLSNLMDSETSRERILEGTYSVSMQIQTKELVAKIIKDSRFGKEGSLKVTPMSMDLKMVLPYREAKSFAESLSGKAATVPFVLLKNGEKVLCDIDGDSVRLEFEDEKDRKAEVFARFSFEKPIEPEEVEKTSIGLAGDIYY